MWHAKNMHFSGSGDAFVEVNGCVEPTHLWKAIGFSAPILRFSLPRVTNRGVTIRHRFVSICFSSTIFLFLRGLSWFSFSAFAKELFDRQLRKWRDGGAAQVDPPTIGQTDPARAAHTDSPPIMPYEPLDVRQHPSRQYKQKKENKIGVGGPRSSAYYCTSRSFDEDFNLYGYCYCCCYCYCYCYCDHSSADGGFSAAAATSPTTFSTPLTDDAALAMTGKCLLSV